MAEADLGGDGLRAAGGFAEADPQTYPLFPMEVGEGVSFGTRHGPIDCWRRAGHFG